ncbi:Bug family tripartite tricarboxylate transporter substrate binding protein [Lentilitoribacter sp. EG35]|uniref:Bug family tripartite tricarboxylate transporter substrate binding protein n=1 Tax=Lentilitoribacter sp. EG35 TaxID=3234192 RepID=UPI0034607D36
MKSRIMAAIVAATIFSLPAKSDTFPEKEITVIVNYGAGGGTDLSTRALAAAMEESLGQSTKVVNRSGGSGTVGPTFVAFTEPDGYTIGVTSFSPLAVTPHMRDVPYNVDSFRYLGGYVRYTYGIAVSADSPYQSIQDIVDAGKNGVEIKYAGASSIGAVAMSRLGDVAGIKFKLIRYKSGKETTTAVLSDQVDIMIGNVSDIVPFVEAGQLRALASASNVRLPGLPDISTLKELGFDTATESYAGLGVPAKTGDSEVAALEAAMKAAFDDAEFQATLEKIGLEPAYFSGADYQKLVHEGYSEMGDDLANLGMAK